MATESDKSSVWLPALSAALAAGLLHFLAFPPLDFGEAAYIFAVPLCFLACYTPRWKPYAVSTFAGMFISWLALMIWLRHVPWAGGAIYLGLLLLALVLALFPTAWFLVARWLFPRILRKNFPIRLVCLLGLSGFWVLLEWLRSWLFTGFPWLPLAASQWLRPAMLQFAAAGGAWAVSFFLIFFNTALVMYLCRLRERVPDKPMLRPVWFYASPEVFVALAIALGSLWQFTQHLPRGESQRKLEVAIVQPYISAQLKWKLEEQRQNMRILYDLTREVAAPEAPADSPPPEPPDLIFWPETATPAPVHGDKPMQSWVESIAISAGTPLVMGNMAVEVTDEEEQWFNTIAVVTPQDGLLAEYYGKRRLVPFGEYIPKPVAAVLPFMRRVADVMGEFYPGDSVAPLEVQANGETWRIGALVCYEDIFPQLSRETAAGQPDFLYVVTNDAWYGEEAGAYQHAAHSVLRAVETRRPIVRCGNNGWSGWIDELGRIRHVSTGEDGSIYHRMSERFEVSLHPAFAGKTSKYVRSGDWFVALSAVLCLLTIYLSRSPDKRES